jgi:hypothetical protein
LERDCTTFTAVRAAVVLDADVRAAGAIFVVARATVVLDVVWGRVVVERATAAFVAAPTLRCAALAPTPDATHRVKIVINNLACFDIIL